MKTEKTYNDMINYPKLESNEFEVIRSYTDEGLVRTEYSVITPFGYNRVAEVIKPENKKINSAAIFIHWYEPGEPATSNRFQFIDEAKKLAELGTICICVETLWSDLDFFYKRTQADDFQNSYREIINLRRFLDLLYKDQNISVTKTVLVGHDFGGMYGLLLGSIDDRINNFVIMAATSRFSDWYLYYPEINETDKEEFRSNISTIDPYTVAPGLKHESILFQFGNNDPHVPIDKANELFTITGIPKEVKFYDSGHGLNIDAKEDRTKWIRDVLKL